MVNCNYLLSLVNKDNKEIYNTWESMGSLIIDVNTKCYIKDTFFKVSCDEGVMNNALVYCMNTYMVNGDDRPLIDWNTLTIEGTEGQLGVFQGVEIPYFKVILDGNTVFDLEYEFENNGFYGSTDSDSKSNEFTPYSGTNQSKTDILIDDDELCILLGECGVPFLRIDELDLTRDAICNYCIKPALDKYYGFFPIVEEENLGSFAAGSSFKKEFPKNAFAAIPYYVLGNSTSGGASFGSGAFSLFREQMMYGGVGMNGSFGNGVHYRKNVPGYTGLNGYGQQAAMQSMAAQQGYTNYLRREHVKTVKENGKKYATGYSTVGGMMNIKWFKKSYDWNDINYSLLPDVRDLCKAYILRNLGMLNALVKSDLPGVIDFSLYNQRSDTLEEKVITKWDESMTNYSYAIMRGGL